MSESQGASGLSCGGGHLFVWAGTPGAMADGWPCVCGATRWESQVSEMACLEAENAALNGQVEALLGLLGRVMALVEREYNAVYDLAADIKAEILGGFTAVAALKEE